jgi:hypothetical protein
MGDENWANIGRNDSSDESSNSNHESSHFFSFFLDCVESEDERSTMYDVYTTCPSKLNNIFKNKVVVPTIVRKLFELWFI